MHVHAYIHIAHKRPFVHTCILFMRVVLIPYLCPTAYIVCVRETGSNCVYIHLQSRLHVKYTNAHTYTHTYARTHTHITNTNSYTHKHKHTEKKRTHPPTQFEHTH